MATVTNDIADETLAAMDLYGGSFVRALAALYLVADPDNRATLRHAFAKIFEEYAGIATDHLR